VPGFNAPGILFVGAWGAADREFLTRLVGRLRPHYDLAVEPCAGAFAMSLTYRHVGFEPKQLEASDVGLFSATLGSVFAGRHPEELGIQVDGSGLDLPDDPVQAAARVLFTQALIRLELKPDVHHWREHVRALLEGQEKMERKIAEQLRSMDERLHGMSYWPMDMVEHIRMHADNPKALIFIAPPTYKAGYERFFDTKGRLEWAEPSYSTWDPDADHEILARESEDFQATLVSMQMTAETGKCHHNEPLYARHERRGVTTYIWTNKPGKVLRWLSGKTAVPRALPDNERLEGVKILPHDHRLTPRSKVSIVALQSKQVRYYKDLWLHRISPKDAGWDFAVLVDGHLVGIAGYDAGMMDYRPQVMWEDALTLFYAVGAPGRPERLTRLVMAIALLRETVDQIVPPWQACRARQVMTVNLTKYPEAKQNRGILKLVDRQKDKTHGYKLVYAASIADQTAQEAFRTWLSKEQKRLTTATR
jgi:hypothetical protein